MFLSLSFSKMCCFFCTNMPAVSRIVSTNSIWSCARLCVRNVRVHLHVSERLRCLQSRWQDDWGQKYGQRSAGLPVSQLQRLGRQILEALLFLKDRGFPPCSHLHSGNIILQNGVAR
jgi:hypothetical protein